MHIVICTKQVVDPDGVNSYAIWGRLDIGDDGTIQNSLPLIINAYDDQALEAALRIRDDGVDCKLTAITVGSEEAGAVIKHALAMGADESILIEDSETSAADGFRTGRLIAAAIQELGDVDLVLCGRQASDGDQGTVPAVVSESLDTAYVTLASDVRIEGEEIKVTRATPAGEEIVLAKTPAVVTVSNELGIPRYPTSAGSMRARRQSPTVRPASELLTDNDHAIELVDLFVPEVSENCEIIEGDDATAKAEALLRHLEEAGVL